MDSDEILEQDGTEDPEPHVEDFALWSRFSEATERKCREIIRAWLEDTE